MRIVFAGTPLFALPTLEMLRAAGHSITGVYTRPDRPSGRGRKITPSPIKQYTLAHGLPLHQPTTLRGAEGALAALAPDVMVVVAYGLILPPAVLAVPPHGCLNVHASLLPRWRGAAPIARAIEAGDTETGVTIMQMEAGLDTGPMLLQHPLPITETDTTATLEQRLATLGAEMLQRALAQVATKTLTARAQDDTKATYAAKLQKTEAAIDWSQPASRLHRKVRALNPWPVASTTLGGEVLRLWDVGRVQNTQGTTAAPGAVVAADATGIYVRTGDGTLCVTQLQTAGSRVFAAREFLNGTRLTVGSRLGT